MPETFLIIILISIDKYFYANLQNLTSGLGTILLAAMKP